MGWESSDDTLGEIKLEFDTKEMAINYAKIIKLTMNLLSWKKNFCNKIILR